jgi:hypothetical protein
MNLQASLGPLPGVFSPAAPAATPPLQPQEQEYHHQAAPVPLLGQNFRRSTDFDAGDGARTEGSHLEGSLNNGGAESQCRPSPPPPPATAAGAHRRGGSLGGVGVGQSNQRESQFRGVTWDKQGGKWRARLHTDKTRHIGYYETEREAAAAWDLAALKYFGVEIENKLNFRQTSVAHFRQLQASGAAGDGPPTAAAKSAQAGAVAAAGSKGVPHPRYRGVWQVGARFKVLVQKKRNHVVAGGF